MPKVPKLLGHIIALLAISGMLNACQRASYSLPVSTRPVEFLSSPQATVEPTRVASPTLLSSDALPQAQRGSRSRSHKLPIKPRLVAQLPQPIVANAATTAVAELHHQKRPPVAVDVIKPPLRQRSRTVAIILAVLSLAYLPLGLHNFYLGYYGRGALTVGLMVVGFYLLLLGVVGLFATSSSLTGIGVLGLGMLIGGYCWQLADLIRIATGSLQPKDGSYRDSNKHL